MTNTAKTTLIVKGRVQCHLEIKALEADLERVRATKDNAQPAWREAETRLTQGVEAIKRIIESLHKNRGDLREDDTMNPLTEEQLDTLNPGIRHTVKTLREWGCDTCDSGDGRTHDHACDQPFPYVHISVHPMHLVANSITLYARLTGLGINFDNAPNPQDDPEGYAKHPTIEASYSPVDGHAFITLTNVIIPES